MVVESVSAVVNGTSTSSLVITKPAGLVVDELLVAVISGNNGGNTETDYFSTAPTGWSTAQANIFENRVSQSIFYKVATSSDVAASNFTFTATGVVGFPTGILLRCSDNNIVDGGLGVADNDNDADGGATFTGTLATAYTPPGDDSLVILMASDFRAAGGATDIGGYDTVTTGISFTEAYDRTSAASGRTAAAAAYGIQTTAAELSTYTNTFTGNTPTESWGSIVVFNSPVNATGTNTLATATAASFVQAGTCDTIGGNVLAEATAVMLPQTGTGTTPLQWAADTRPSTNWVKE